MTAHRPDRGAIPPRPLPGDGGPRPARGAVALVLATLVAAILLAALLALGVWQLERRAWKHDLVARVTRRLSAPPVAAPAPRAWPRLGADAAYARLRTTGSWLPVAPTLTQAATDRGAGYWTMAPFRDARGFVLLVNRGFVGSDRPAATLLPPPGAATVTGLLRLTEPHGGFLRTNDPAAGRWHSRDVAAIAAARGLGPVAPYFLDADATADRPGGPVGGLTIVAFPDNHMVYAITWFVLAAMVAGGYALLAREELRRRRARP